jgi:hypothetical protein
MMMIEHRPLSSVTEHFHAGAVDRNFAARLLDEKAVLALSGAECCA